MRRSYVAKSRSPLSIDFLSQSPVLVVFELVILNRRFLQCWLDLTDVGTVKSVSVIAVHCAFLKVRF